MSKENCIQLQKHQKLLEVSASQGGSSQYIYVLRGLDSGMQAPRICKDIWDISYYECVPCLHRVLKARESTVFPYEEPYRYMNGKYMVSNAYYFRENFQKCNEWRANLNMLRIVIEHEMQFHERSRWHRFKGWLRGEK